MGAQTYGYTYVGGSPLVQRLDRPNGSFTAYQYDGLNRLTALSNRRFTGEVINEFLNACNAQDLRVTRNGSTAWLAAWLLGRALPEQDETKQSPAVLYFAAAREQFIPITPKRSAQTHERWQAREVSASLDVLKVACAHADFFGQFFLSQIPTRPQGSHVLSEPRSMRAGFGFAHRHCRILPKSFTAKLRFRQWGKARKTAVGAAFSELPLS